MYIKIINDDKEYVGTLTVLDAHTIRVEGLPHTTSGFRIYINKKYKKMIGDYSQFTAKYRTVDAQKQIYEYSDDAHEYVIKPIPIDNDDDDKPKKIEWTLEDYQVYKIAELEKASKKMIEKGELVTLSDGSKEQFSYTQPNQINLSNAFYLAMTMGDKVPYYNANNTCKLYSAEDIIRIYASCQTLATYHMTLLHQLSDEVKNMEEIKDVQEVEYDISNLDERHKKLFDTIMEQTKKVVLKVTGANEKIKSEEDAEAKATS
jgi:hypothetical protein